MQVETGFGNHVEVIRAVDAVCSCSASRDLGPVVCRALC